MLFRSQLKSVESDLIAREQSARKIHQELKEQRRWIDERLEEVTAMEDAVSADRNNLAMRVEAAKRQEADLDKRADNLRNLSNSLDDEKAQVRKENDSLVEERASVEKEVCLF